MFFDKQDNIITFQYDTDNILVRDDPNHSVVCAS